MSHNQTVSFITSLRFCTTTGEHVPLDNVMNCRQGNTIGRLIGTAFNMRQSHIICTVHCFLLWPPLCTQTGTVKPLPKTPKIGFQDLLFSFELYKNFLHWLPWVLFWIISELPLLTSLSPLLNYIRTSSIDFLESSFELYQNFLHWLPWVLFWIISELPPLTPLSPL